MSLNTGSYKGSHPSEKWWNQPGHIWSSRNSSTESLDCSEWPSLHPREPRSRKASVSRPSGWRAGMSSIVSGLSPFSSKKPTARVYSRPSTHGTPGFTGRPVLHVPAPQPTRLQRMAQSALSTAASVASGITGAASSMFKPCFGTSRRRPRYVRPILDDSSVVSFVHSDYTPASDYENDAKGFRMERSSSFAPSGATSRPKDKADMMSQLKHGLSQWMSNSPYSGTESVDAMTDPSDPPPSYSEAMDLTSYDPSHTGDTNARETEAALWQNFQHTRDGQDRSENVKMWGRWIKNRGRRSTDANGQSTSRHTGGLPFAAISVPQWASDSALVSSQA